MSLFSRRSKHVHPDRPSSPSVPPEPIDTEMFGLPGSTAAYLLRAARPALIDVGSASTVPRLLDRLEAKGVDHLEAIVLTHIHLDNAGAAGHLARRFPEATVYVAGPSARLLADEDKLLGGVRSVWGDDTERHFGLPLPVPRNRIREVEDGDRIDLGDRDLLAVSTPGHTGSHLAFLDESTGSVVCGDALGIHLPDSEVTRPASPPTDFSFPDALDSIERIRSLGAQKLFLSHYGPTGTEPGESCDRAARALHGWHDALLRERQLAEGDEDLVRRIHCALEAGLETAKPSVRRQLEVVNPAWLNVAGMSVEQDRRDHRRAA